MKHTKGKVVIDKYGSIVTENGSKLLVKGIEIPLGQHEEAEANAELIAEAFNVTNECGLTPRQLLDAYNKVMGTIEDYKKEISNAYHQGGEDAIKNYR